MRITELINKEYRISMKTIIAVILCFTTTACLFFLTCSLMILRSEIDILRVSNTELVEQINTLTRKLEALQDSLDSQAKPQGAEVFKRTLIYLYNDPFYSKVLGGTALGLAVVLGGYKLYPLLTLKNFMPGFLYSFIQNHTWFFQETLQFTLYDDVNKISWISAITNNKDLSIYFKTDKMVDYKSVLTFADLLKSNPRMFDLLLPGNDLYTNISTGINPRPVYDTSMVHRLSSESFQNPLRGPLPVMEYRSAMENYLKKLL